MKYNKALMFGMLRYYADAQPHKFWEQQQLMIIRYKKDLAKYKVNFVEMIRYMVQNGWLMGVGSEFAKTYFPFRYFVLTKKGDSYFRAMSIEKGSDYHTTKYFDRDDPKNN